MICSRCGVLLLEDRFMDWAARWRCLKCGNVQAVIEVENAVRLRTKLYPPGQNEEGLPTAKSHRLLHGQC
jgi:hypothetical protein